MLLEQNTAKRPIYCASCVKKAAKINTCLRREEIEREKLC